MAGDNDLRWETQHKYFAEQIQNLRERVVELERLVRLLSEGHGLTEAIRPTPDVPRVRQWADARQ